MTSEEIKDRPKLLNHPDAEKILWLREIAYQLAVANEREVGRDNTAKNK